MTKRISTSARIHRILRVRPLILALCSAGCMSATMAQTQQRVEMPRLVGEEVAGSISNASTKLAGSAGTPDAIRSVDVSNPLAPVHTFNQSANLAVWKFSSFSIGAGGTVNNVATNVRSTTVFHVVGTERSQLFGALNANNKLVLVNRNGIHAFGGASFGGAGSLVMSAHDLDPDLVANNYAKLQANPSYIRFINNAEQFIDNDGPGGSFGSYGDPVVQIDPEVRIVAGNGGSIFLVGDQVRNQGSLSAANGHVGLVASGDVELELGDSGFITLKSHDVKPGENRPDASRIAVNDGTIEAADGAVTLAQASFGQRTDSSESVSTPDVVFEAMGEQGPPSGVYNLGTISTKGVAGTGSVTLEAKGLDNAAINTGTIDASGTGAAATGGSIRMSAANVLHGGSGGSEGTSAQLVANGTTAGGTITLDNVAGSVGGESISQVYASSASAISATATGAGKGGTVRMGTSAPDDGSVWAPTGRVIARGAIDAQGAGGGQGGTLEMAGRIVSARQGQSSANILLGASGLWKVASTNVTIGSTFFEGEGGLNGTFIHPDQISALLDQGAHVNVQARHTGNEGSVFEEGFLDIEPGAGIQRTVGGAAVDLTLEATHDLTVGSGASITSTAGALNVTLNADSDKASTRGDGRGSLIIGAPAEVPSLQFVPLDSTQEDVSPVSFTEGAVAQALAVGEGPAVLITTNGGNLQLSGAGQPPSNVSDAGATNNAGVSIRNAEFDAGQGTVTIAGAGGSTGSEGGSSQNGVSISNAEITGRSVSIFGTSTSATGVSLANTEITGGTGQIAVVGTSEGGGSIGQHIGVDIQDNVVFNVGSGGAKVHGLSDASTAGSVGLRIKSLKLVTEGATAPLITLAGQSAGANGLGIQLMDVAEGEEGLVLQGPTQMSEDETESILTSAGEVIIGADAGAGQALQIGNRGPVWNTTGRINIRPVSMEINNPQQITAFNNKVIRVGGPGTGSAATTFNIDSRWLTPSSIPGGMVPTAQFVIGSNSHTGSISVADNALNNTGAVSLQNQGVQGAEGAPSLRSGGIALGQQNGIQKLNLLSSGDISQSGPLRVTTLNIKMGPTSVVALNAAGNQIGEVNHDGGSTRPAVSAPARASAGDASIAGFNASASTFQTLSVTNREVDTPDIDRTFEGTDLMNELRTDVYVHGQLSRPQLCTPANTAGGASSVSESGADSLALEWVKVRRGPQLTNCAGMRADSNCAAF